MGINYIMAKPIVIHEHESGRRLLEARVQQVRGDLVQQERIAKELQQQKVQVAVLEQGKGALEQYPATRRSDHYNLVNA